MKAAALLSEKRQQWSRRGARYGEQQPRVAGTIITNVALPFGESTSAFEVTHIACILQQHQLGAVRWYRFVWQHEGVEVLISPSDPLHCPGAAIWPTYMQVFL